MSVATLPLDYPAIKVNRAFATLDAEEAAALEVDILDLLERSNWAATVVSSSRATISKL
jgi:hypothetical protein